jgi:hypothetical protein
VRQTPSVNVNRPDEFSSDFLLLSMVQVASAAAATPGSSTLLTRTPAADSAAPQEAAACSAASTGSAGSSSTGGNTDTTSGYRMPRFAAAIVAEPAQGLPPVSCLVKVCLQDAPFLKHGLPELVSKVRH